MNELIREIEEDIRHERLAKLWHSFGKLLVGVSIGIILATIIVVVWQNNRQEYAMEKTSLLIKGIDRMNIEDYKGAITAFDELAGDEHLPYYGLAMLQKAKAQELLGDKAGAAKTYQQLSTRENAFGELGKLLATYNGTSPFVPERGAVFYYALSEWRAWQFLAEGKKDSAIDLFTSLSYDPDAPSSMRARLTLLLEHLAPGKALQMHKAAPVDE